MPSPPSIKVKLEIEGMAEKDKKIFENVIEKGMFENIYDIVDEYMVN